MAHGTPLGIGDNDERYGAQGAFLIEAGISSSYHIANFFGLTEWIASDGRGSVARKPPGNEGDRSQFRRAAPTPVRTPDLADGAVAADDAQSPSEPARARQPRAGIDVGAVITRALTAAGLMK